MEVESEMDCSFPQNEQDFCYQDIRHETYEYIRCRFLDWIFTRLGTTKLVVETNKHVFPRSTRLTE